MKCSRCGNESDIAQAFTVKKQWAGLVTRTLCPECSGKEGLPENLLTAGLFVAFLFILDAWTIRRGTVRLAADFLFLLAANLPILVAHELFHAAAGSLLGVKVFRVTFGAGRLLASRRALGITWEWRLWPTAGGTVMAPPPQEGNRARMFGAVLAGPAAHVVLMVAAALVQILLMILQGWFHVQTVALVQWTGLFIAFDLILLLSTLFPRRVATPNGLVGTDGWQLLHLLFMKPDEEILRDQTYYGTAAMDAVSRNDADDALRWAERGLEKFPNLPILLAFQGEALILKKQFARARGNFQSLLASDAAKDPVFKYLTYNNIAYLDALMRNPEWLSEADRLSAEALRQLPWEPSIIGTRGTVLLELNRLEEGIALLKRALAKHQTPAGKAANAYHLADGEARRGNVEASRRYLELARKTDPHHFLME